jgi:LysM repeat protein
MALYTVRAGDTMGAIASRNGVSLQQLAAANPGIRNLNSIRVGQQISIPSGSGSGSGSGAAPAKPPSPAPAPGPVTANTWNIDVASVLALHNELDHVTYELGAKARMSADPSSIRKIDCSGYVRFVLYNASNGRVDCSPNGGTWWQEKWCNDNRLASSPYDQNGAGASDGKLRIAFKKSGGIGHVWLLHNGYTYESYGGHGVGRKVWNERSGIVGSCFVF